MPAFNDNSGHDWNIRFDGVTLGELRDTHGIDLADITGETYLKLETDQATLTKAVCFLCSDQLAGNAVTATQLANLLCGEVAEAAMQAIWGAAKVFFRPKLWCALDCAYKTRKTMADQWAEMAPAMAMLNQPDLPAAMREAVMESLAMRMNDLSGSSPASEESPSATGQDATLSTPVIASPALAESAHAA